MKSMSKRYTRGLSKNYPALIFPGQSSSLGRRNLNAHAWVFSTAFVCASRWLLDVKKGAFRWIYFPPKILQQILPEA